jgi:hypothetical protein
MAPSDREKIAPHPRPLDSTRRTIFDEFGCRIYGYPSTGGNYHPCQRRPVELKQLNFDPLNPPSTRFSDQGKEDDYVLNSGK